MDAIFVLFFVVGLSGVIELSAGQAMVKFVGVKGHDGYEYFFSQGSPSYANYWEAREICETKGADLLWFDYPSESASLAEFARGKATGERPIDFWTDGHADSNSDYAWGPDSKNIRFRHPNLPTLTQNSFFWWCGGAQQGSAADNMAVAWESNGAQPAQSCLKAAPTSAKKRFICKKDVSATSLSNACPKNCKRPDRKKDSVVILY